MLSVNHCAWLVGAAACALVFNACSSKSTGNAGPSFVDGGPHDLASDRPTDTATDDGSGSSDVVPSDGGVPPDGADAPMDLVADAPAGDTPGGDTPGGDTPGGDAPGGDAPGADARDTAPLSDARDTATPTDALGADLPALDARDALPTDVGAPDVRDGNGG